MKCTTLIVALFIFVPQLRAQDAGSGLDFLNIGPSARMLSISEAHTASQIGAASIYSNPAMLAMEKQSGLDVNYTLWVAGLTNQYAAVNLRNNNRALAFGVYNSRADNFEARDNPGPSQGSFSVGYLSLSAAYAYRFGPISLGLTTQYLREEVFQFRAGGYAFNLGVAARFLDERITIGTSVMNLGEMDDLDLMSSELPALFRTGIEANLLEVRTPGFNDLPLLVTLHADFVQPLTDSSGSDFTSNDTKDPSINLALSADVADIIFLQTGFTFGPTERPVSFGLGFNIEPVRFNYALVPFTTGYGTVHSIGLQYEF
jgi:hypothetical protein